MKKISSVLLLLLICFDTYSQLEGNRIDSTLRATVKRKKTDKIIIGNRGTGTAYFYLKGTRQVFSIINRKQQFSESRKIDSAFNYAYFFINDSLVRATYDRYYFKKRKGGNERKRVDMFFRENVIVEKRQVNDTWIPHATDVLKEAESYLQNAKHLIQERGK
jgi:hypothetical protein